MAVPVQANPIKTPTSAPRSLAAGVISAIYDGAEDTTIPFPIP